MPGQETELHREVKGTFGKLLAVAVGAGFKKAGIPDKAFEVAEFVVTGKSDVAQASTQGLSRLSLRSQSRIQPAAAAYPPKNQSIQVDSMVFSLGSELADEKIAVVNLEVDFTHQTDLARFSRTFQLPYDCTVP